MVIFVVISVQSFSLWHSMSFFCNSFTSSFISSCFAIVHVSNCQFHSYIHTFISSVRKMARTRTAERIEEYRGGWRSTADQGWGDATKHVRRTGSKRVLRFGCLPMRSKIQTDQSNLFNIATTRYESVHENKLEFKYCLMWSAAFWPDFIDFRRVFSAGETLAVGYNHQMKDLCAVRRMFTPRSAIQIMSQRRRSCVFRTPWSSPWTYQGQPILHRSCRACRRLRSPRRWDRKTCTDWSVRTRLACSAARCCFFEFGSLFDKIDKPSEKNVRTGNLRVSSDASKKNDAGDKKNWPRSNATASRLCCIARPFANCPLGPNPDITNDWLHSGSSIAAS